MSWAGSDRSKRLPSNWRTLRDMTLGRDNYLCVMRLPGCTIDATQVDHIIAGDNHALSNLRSVCEWCHGKKTAQEGNAAKRLKYSANHRQPEKHPGLS